MRKWLVVLATALALAVAVAAYFAVQDGRSPPGADGQQPFAEDAEVRAKARADVPPPTDAGPAPGELVAPEGGPRRLSGGGRVLGELFREGAEWDFTLIDGDIGYVDVEATARRREPHSILALLRLHNEYSGANDALDVKITGVVEHDNGNFVVDYEQDIGGIPVLDGRGTVLFKPDGAVYRLSGRLLNASLARPDQIVILQHEAEALAYEAASSYVGPDDAYYRSQGLTNEIEVFPGANLRYANNPGGDPELRAEWKIPVARGWGGVMVVIEAASGNVVDIIYMVQSLPASPYFHAQASCSSVNFRVCEAGAATKDTCERSDLNKVEVIYDQGVCKVDQARCNMPEFRIPNDTAYAAIAYIGQRGDYLGHIKQIAHRTNCNIDIMVGYQSKVGSQRFAVWTEPANVIAIGAPRVVRPPSGPPWLYDPAADVLVTAHETYHAVSKVFGGDIEEGMAQVAGVLYAGGDEGQWRRHLPSGNREKIAGSPLDDGVVEAMYRIYTGMNPRNRDEVFKLILETDKNLPSSPSVSDLVREREEALDAISASDTLRQSIARALSDMYVRYSNFNAMSHSLKAFFWRWWEDISDYFDEPDWAEEIGELLDDWWESVNDDNMLQSE